MKRYGNLMLSVIALGTIMFLAARAYWTPERKIKTDAVDRRTIALRVLGEYLAETTPGSQLLVVANPFAQRPGQPGEVYDFEKAALKGLREGANGGVTVLGPVYPELTAAAAKDPSSVFFPPDVTTPLSFMTTPAAWDELQRAHPEAGVWISLIGLPANVGRMNVWREPKPRFALLLPDLRLMRDPSTLRDAFRSGKILAAVLNRPGAPPESLGRESDYRAEFERRFILLTETNVADVLRRFPTLF